MEIKFLKSVVLFILASCVLVHCSEDDYLQDEGVSNPNYAGNMLEYLKSRPDLFTKLVDIIEYTELEDVFTDSTLTFFAPTDYSINSTLKSVNYYLYRYGNDTVQDIRQIDAEVWKDYLTLYMIPEKYLLKDIPQLDTMLLEAYGGQAYISYNSRPMNIGTVYHEANGVQYAGYRQLYFSYIYDFSSSDLIHAPVATSDIQPTNGAVHVLRYSRHDFAFSWDSFYNAAMSAGIKDPDEITEDTD